MLWKISFFVTTIIINTYYKSVIKILEWTTSMLQNLYLSSTYLSISIGARIAAPKSKAFLLMNINIFVSIFNNFFPVPQFLIIFEGNLEFSKLSLL